MDYFIETLLGLLRFCSLMPRDYSEISAEKFAVDSNFSRVKFGAVKKKKLLLKIPNP